MAISIDPSTFVITIPKADMLLVQSTPIEVRELNIDNFRLELKDWEDGPGITFQKTHDHNTSVTISGVQLARVVEILEPYTITFEDGNYAVNLVGANSNIGDRVNLNSVSVRAANSAGLIQTREIEYASFNGKVTVDINSGNSGTAYPFGTPAYPVNNLSDAVFIANLRGFSEIHILSSMTIENVTISNMTITAKSHIDTEITIADSAICEDITIINANVNGVLDGGTNIYDSSIGDLTYFNGHIHNSSLHGTITLNGSSLAALINCSSIDQDDLPVVDMNGSGQSLAMPNFSGIITIKNLTSATEEIGIGLNAGKVVLDSTITAGTAIISGVGILQDNSTGTAIVNTDGLMNKDTIATTVWDEDLSTHQSSGTSGLSLAVQQFDGAVHIDTSSGNSGTTFPIGTARVPVDNLTDALTIATARGLNEIQLVSDITIDNGDNVSGYIFHTDTRREVTFVSGCITMYSAFRNCGVTGTAGGHIALENCSIDGLDEFYGIAENCTQSGTLTLSSNNTKNAVIVDLITGNVTSPPTIDCNGDGAKLSLRGLTGAALFTNKTGSTQKMFIDLYSARVGFDSTVTAGTITVRGTGYIYLDDSTGTTFDTQGLMSLETISDQVWEEASADHTTSTTMGGKLNAASSGGVDYDSLAAAVWNRVTSSHTTPGTFGNQVGSKLLSVAKFLGLK